MTSPVDQSRRLIRLCILLAVTAAVAVIAAVLGIGSAMGKRVIVIGSTDTGRFIPAISLDQPYLNDPRVQAFAEECLRASFSHDFRNFRRTMSLAQECYTVQAAGMYASAMEPLLADLQRRRMVMTPVVDRPPIVVRAYLNQRGVFTWDLQARIILTREGTAERIPPAVYDVSLRISRATIEQSVRGILVSNIELTPGS
jgi:hypothetical protein